MKRRVREQKNGAADTPRVAGNYVGGGAIVIRGARVNNLKNISLELPRNRLIVITGVSGSGKSSLAFDTIYAEGQRRYVESLSAYARQFLERVNKPDVDFIDGIAPAVAIEQKTSARNPRSTVGTTTEIYDYLRLLYARIGRTYCLHDGSLVQHDSVRTVMERLESLTDDTRLLVLFPMHAHEGRTLSEEFDHLRKQGYIRVMVHGELFNLESDRLPEAEKADVFVVVDRLTWKKDGDTARASDSIETAFREGDGYMRIRFTDSGEEWKFSTAYECSVCHRRYAEPDPRLFSFNNPAGACPNCQGFGRTAGIDPSLVVPNPAKTLAEGAIQPWTTPKHSKHYRDLERIASSLSIPLHIPYKDLTDEQKEIIWNGTRGFKGVRGFFRMIEEKSYKMHYRILAARYRGYTTCEACGGSRLQPDALAVRVQGKTLAELVRMTIEDLCAFFSRVEFTEGERAVAQRIIDEIRTRLKILNDIGLGYLTLDRLSHTLSGGESQRINIAAALGSSLVGTLYVLDEPTIGLHPRDNKKLIKILRSLRDAGNTVLVVEHDREMMEVADFIVDMGPRAGEEGGEIVVLGTLQDVAQSRGSLTGKYLSGRASIPLPAKRRTPKAELVVLGPTQNNLKGMDVHIPLGVLTCVTGVSGSGKSTLVHDVLYTVLRRELEGGVGDEESCGACLGLKGAEIIRYVEMVDQSPIGRTPRSNPVTYIKAFDVIRELFAETTVARMRGFNAGTFSFNVRGGRCDTCEGEGFIKVEMQFMADLYLVCESCKGTRYKAEVVDVQYHGKSIVDVLNMSVTEALEFFRHVPRLVNRLRVLDEVGLGYLKLGQPATTLSGGEAQRLKLASHLANRPDEHTLFIFDEPTTGLHFDDTRKLLACFDALIAMGHSVLIIEHNLDVIKCADWVIDLGPEGGERGGMIVAQGTPEDVAATEGSYTGMYLHAVLMNGRSGADGGNMQTPRRRATRA
ncbi:MAG: excinuclease ABC subunit UvrA [Bacteroidota bacterium]|nr:excinuclease ABC subunit UvrA [Bacteroidota bacterium]